MPVLGELSTAAWQTAPARHLCPVCLPCLPLSAWQLQQNLIDLCHLAWTCHGPDSLMNRYIHGSGTDLSRPGTVTEPVLTQAGHGPEHVMNRSWHGPVTARNRN